MVREKLTIPSFRSLKEAGRKVKMVTAYDYTSAVLVERSPVDVILVGDSLGMVMMGYAGTTGVTMTEMLHHLRAVLRGAPHTFTVADMPFGSYNVSPAQAVANANALIKTGADAVKIEGGVDYAETVRALVRAGIPVVGHVGLTPQTATSLGGFKLQGKDAETAGQIIRDAQALEATGAFAIVLEMVPAPLAAHLTSMLGIPTIGIGAGAGCNGQVLVWHDMFGLYGNYAPRFAKRYADAGRAIGDGLTAFCAEVDSGAFPAPEHSFKMRSEELDRATNNLAVE